MKSPLIIGLGSPHGDDHAGWIVIERLRANGLSTAAARVARTPADIWDWCAPSQPLVLCDACVNIGVAGTLRRWMWPQDVLPVSCGGTHDLSLGEVLTVARELGTLPETVTVWTITGMAFHPQSQPSPAVSEAAAVLAERLAGELCHA